MKTIQTALILAAALLLSMNAFALNVEMGGAIPSSSTHDTLVIVIDGSGSMRDSISDGSDVRKITAAKASLKSVIDQIPQTTHVGVLLFVGDEWGHDSTLKWLAAIGPMNKHQLKATIDAINPSGGTPLGRSLKMAADELVKARAAQNNYGTYQLLVVTDGEATDGDLMDTYAKEIKKPERRIQFDVIGIGMPGKHMLSRIADRYWGANDAIALNKALETAVKAENTNAAAAEADFELLKDVPDDVAKFWLADTTNMDFANWPIGESKPEPQAPANAQNADPNAAGNQPAPQGAAPPAQGRQKGCNASSAGINPVPTAALALCLISLVALRRRKTVRVRDK